MSDLWLRAARDEDTAAIAALTRAAFGGEAEVDIIEKLARDGDSLASLIAHDDREILGHIQFFPVLVDADPCAAGLGPMAVAPAHQNRSIGSQMVRFGLTLMEGQGHGLIFVLGHRDFYGRFGFSADCAAPFASPWPGPAFMARRLIASAPGSGTLTYPAAFAART